MLIESAYDLITIISDYNYLNDIKKGDGPIFKIHALIDNGDEVKVQSFKGEEITFPPGSFIQGATYSILVKKMKFNKKSKFVGYRLKSKPYALEI